MTDKMRDIDPATNFFTRDEYGSFSKVVASSNRIIDGCTLPFTGGFSLEVKEYRGIPIHEESVTTPETSRWIGRDVYDLIRACDLALNWADADARAFPIETMPIKGLFLAWDVINGDWEFTTAYQVAENEDGRYTHWTHLPPPPSNPPLPEPLERLGEVLRRVKNV